jgi:hypothetical protein
MDIDIGGNDVATWTPTGMKHLKGLGIGTNLPPTLDDDRFYIGDDDFYIDNLSPYNSPRIVWDHDTSDRLRYVVGSNLLIFEIGAASAWESSDWGMKIINGLDVGFSSTPIADTIRVGSTTGPSVDPTNGFSADDFNWAQQAAKTNQIFYFGPALMIVEDPDVSGYNVAADETFIATNQSALLPMILPVGAVIKEVVLTYDTKTATSGTKEIRLFGKDWNDATLDDFGNDSNGSTGSGLTLTIGSLSVTVTAGQVYSLRILNQMDALISAYGVKVTVDLPAPTVNGLNH